MTTTTATAPATTADQVRSGTAAVVTLVLAIMGFFIVTFDAVVVNVALPTIRTDLGGGITGLQWVVDAYTLMFAALLLTSGALSDRVGARCAFTTGLVGFVVASLACGLAPNMVGLVIARFVQGSAAALMMPASMALIGQVSAVVAMGGLTYGAIEAGKAGFGRRNVLIAFGLALVGILAFVISQRR